MTQAAAIFLDAYRELNSRKLFWFTLVLSGLIALSLLVIGLSEDHHIKLLWWKMPFPVPPSVDLSMLLKGTFISVGIQLWLTWAATILALISTASVFPDFLTSGSIELVLSKPIGRLRLFLLKYLSGLLFVALQVGVFTAASFVIIGSRTGEWEAGVFLAIPLVVIFFSYLFGVCVLIGVLTRSTIAALLLTILFWLLLFAINVTDNVLLMPRVMNDVYVERLESKLAAEQQRPDADAARISSLQNELKEATESRDSSRRWHRTVLGVKTALPKTDDTMNLLKRWLISAANLSKAQVEDDDRQQMPFLSAKMRLAGVRVNEVVTRVEQAQRQRPVTWILGSSLAFELLIVAAAAFLFCRRDF
jgi:ABC-type transport system involved in multi-copper enzyme maturation permease subunit